jgi:hypothetical protein
MFGPGDEERQRPDDADISVVPRSGSCGEDEEVVVVDDSFNVPINLLELDTGLCPAA